jgi:putative spermidine/putrescine transport system substrate-binding protein
MLDPKRQACASTKVPFGRSNMDASKFVDPDIAKQLNTAPENLSRAFWHGVDWWAEVGPDGKSNRDKEMERYSKWLVK